MTTHIYDPFKGATLCGDFKGDTARSVSGPIPSCGYCISAAGLPRSPDCDCVDCKVGLTASLQQPLDKELIEGRKQPVFTVEDYLSRCMDDIETMMLDRHQKYGPGNIAKHGPAGILVRMDDKFARLEAGQGNFDDETVENTLDDIIGYALIWKLWLRGQWPGSPITNKEGS